VGTARVLLGKAETVDDPDERSALEDAKAWLRHTLGFGALDGKELKRLARIEGIPERTLYRAAGALGVDRRAQGFGKARLWSMCAKTPMSASEKGSAETGRHGIDMLVSANGYHTQSLGTHEQSGTHGEGGTTTTGAGTLRQEGDQEGCQHDSLAPFTDVGPLRREAEPFMEDF
jgi:hypothetical protein